MKAHKEATLNCNRGLNGNMVMKINGLVAEFPKGEKIVEIDIDPNNENPLVTGFVDAEFGGHKDKRSVFAAQLYVNAGPVWTDSVSNLRQGREINNGS